MASIYVDVDLSEFSLDEILEEVGCRYDSKWLKNKDAKEKIQKWFSDFFKSEAEEISNSVCSSVNDQIKMDFLIANFDKISLQDLESIIK